MVLTCCWVCLLVNRRCVRSGVRGPCLVCCGQDRRRRCIQYALVCGFLLARTRMWNNANTWVIIEWYLHVAAYVCLLIVGVCVVVCVVLVVCAAVKTGVEDASNMLLCAGSLLRVCCFWPRFFEKTTCYTVMVLYCTQVHQLGVYCHSTVILPACPRIWNCHRKPTQTLPVSDTETAKK